jgi:nucleotide-binding universal stress UspA family protein
MKKILLPTDGHKLSEQALKLGLELAQRLRAGAVIGLVHQPPLSEVELEADKQIRAAEQAVLHRWQRYGDEHLMPLTTRLVEGYDIAQELVALAKETACDMVVMGTHGREGLARLLMGSVAERVVRLAHLPVLLLRLSQTIHTSVEFPKRILVALDGSEASSDALRQAAQLARQLGSELVLLHGIPDVRAPILGYESMMYSSSDPDEVDAQLQLEGHSILQKAKDQIAPLESTAIVSRAKGNRIADLILQTAQEQQADLIAIGTHGYSGLDRLLLGSVAEAVVHHAKVPVLVVRAVSTPEVVQPARVSTSNAPK